jgi:uncharacterized membrane protein YhaH (DUF805 family)
MFKPFLKYAEFTGRARRLEYWLFQLLQLIVYLGVLGLIIGSLTTHNWGGSLGVLGFAALFALGCLVPNLAVTTRRLHDSGRSMWWLMLYAPGILTGINGFHALQSLGSHDGGGLAAPAAQGSLLGLVGNLCNLVLFVLMLLPGNRGANRFGPDPKGGVSEAAEVASIFGDPEAEAAPVRQSGAQDGGKPYKPIFDFGPAPAKSAHSDPAPPRSATGSPAVPPRPTFGKRQ